MYNLIIRGGNEGGLDGIDVWGFNMYIHDVEVTNKDECVTVKASSVLFTYSHYTLLTYTRMAAITSSSKIYIATGVEAVPLAPSGRTRALLKLPTTISTPGSRIRCS